MRGRRTVALVTAPGVIEEWLDPLGVSLDVFRDEMTGGWMFNYVDALATAGIHTVIVCFSEWVDSPRSFEHRPTGATIWMVPPWRRALVERWIAAGRLYGARDPRSVLRGVRRHLAPYAVTPLGPLWRILRREGCDAILSQDYESQRFDGCMLVGTLLRIPVFATFQGGFFPPSWVGDALRPFVMRGCAGLIIPAQREIARVQRRYGVPDEKCALIPNPLDTAAWRGVPRAQARAAFGVPADAGLAVTHGRVDINGKGLDVLLEAWAGVRAERPNRELRLMIVGAGNDSAEVGQMIATGRYPGAQLVDEHIIDPDALRRYLSAADVFAFAGRYEGFPVAPTEAMACGLPVVATDASGIPDLFQNGEASGGLVVPRDDAAALAAGLGRVLDDPKLARELGERARKRVENYCGLESVGRQLEDFMTRRGMGSGRARRLIPRRGELA